MIGETLGQYRIVGALGRGGMGAVYRALDVRLRREVAIKVLTGSEVPTEAERRQLLREARAAAPLNHPAIATIFEVGEHDDLSFIVMELVEGESLRSRVGTMGGDPLRLARLGLAVVQGLREAHGKGVVHGDIKPDNLMLRPDGTVKILDFGVSRRLPHQDVEAIRAAAETLALAERELLADESIGQHLTFGTPGQVAGTLAYMPPEQMRGELIDGRADLYSLGVVLQELATGRRPFDAQSPLAMIARAMSSQSAMVEELALTVPPELSRVLGRMLAASPGDRHGAAQEAEVDFEMAIAALEDREVPGRDERTVVAVMPFELLAGSADDEFLRIALAQAVTHGLTGQKALVVRPTSAVARYLDRAADPQRVASDLRARVIVEGTIQRLGEGLRVQVQGWDAEARSTLFSVKRDARMDGLFELQDRLAHDIAGSLSPEAQRSATDRTPAPQPEGRDPEAYELFLRAGERILRASEYDARTGIELLRRSVALDPGFADAWARLSGAHLLMAVLFDPSDEWYEAAEVAVTRALELDPGNPEAWASQGRLLWSPREGFCNERALRYLTAACRHHAPPHDGLMWGAVVLAHVGLHEEAEHWIRRALEEQPDDLLARLTLGELLSWRGDFGSGLEQYGRLVAADPGNIFSQLFHPIGLIYTGELDRAALAVERARKSFGEDSMFLAAEALIAAERGEHESARQRVRAVRECATSVSHQHHSWHYAAAASAAIGDAEPAVELVRAAAENGFPNYPAFRADPHFAGIRADAAFADLMADLEQRWRSFRAGFGAASRRGR